MTTTISLPATSTEQRQLLLELLATRAYRHGNFTLASGRTSSHYVNCKPVSLSGLGLALLSAQMLELVEPGADGRGSRQNLRRIFRYNHDDALATWVVARWLLEQNGD